MRLYIWQSNKQTLVVIARDLRYARRFVSKEMNQVYADISLNKPIGSYALKDNPKNVPSAYTF